MIKAEGERNHQASKFFPKLNTRKENRGYAMPTQERKREPQTVQCFVNHYD